MTEALELTVNTPKHQLNITVAVFLHTVINVTYETSFNTS